jgi:F-type H+-transporting ATPase subunit b
MSLVRDTFFGDSGATALSEWLAHASGAEAGGVNVDFDASFLVQVAIFLLLLVVLKPLLFEPMLKLFEEREKRIEGAKLEARRIDEQSVGALTSYETAMQKARTAANADREKLRAEGTKRETEILGAVRVTTAQALEEGRKRLDSEVAATRSSLRQSTPALAQELAKRVLGREVQG